MGCSSLHFTNIIMYNSMECCFVISIFLLNHFKTPFSSSNFNRTHKNPLNFSWVDSVKYLGLKFWHLQDSGSFLFDVYWKWSTYHGVEIKKIDKNNMSRTACSQYTESGALNAIFQMVPLISKKPIDVK